MIVPPALASVSVSSTSVVPATLTSMVPSFWKVPVKFLIVLAVPPSTSSLPAMLKLLPARPSMVVCCSSSSGAVPLAASTWMMPPVVPT